MPRLAGPGRLILLAATLALAACAAPRPDPLLGRWYSTDVGSYVFHADGTAVVDDGTTVLDAAWSRLRDGRVELEMTILGVTSTEAFEVEVSGDRAVFTNAAGETEVMTRINHREAMTVTIERMRTLGAAWFSWLTDELGSGAAGESYTLAGLEPLPEAELESLLVPTYISELPTIDGWGRPLEFRLADELTAARVLSIRSAGSDGAFEGDDYEIGAFAASEPTHDLVWADGYFVRWPEAPRQGDQPDPS